MDQCASHGAPPSMVGMPLAGILAAGILASSILAAAEMLPLREMYCARGPAATTPTLPSSKMVKYTVADKKS